MIEGLILGAALAGVAAALGICFAAPAIGTALGVMDQPDQVRKLHGRPTPLVGGIALVPAVLCGLLASAILHENADGALVALAGAAVFLGGLGFVDDRISLGAKRRLVLSLVVFVLLVAVHPVFRTDFIFLGVTEIHIGTVLAASLAVIASTGTLNAFNMADGVNGLALGIAALWLAVLVAASGGPSGIAALIILPAVLVVLIFNLNGRLFLGDTGAYMLGGTVIGLMLLAVGASEMTHAQVVAIMMLPVLDTVWLMAARALSGRSPFAADRTHLHHLLIARMAPTGCLLAYLGAVLAGSLLALTSPEAALASIALQAVLFLAFRISARARPVPDSQAPSARATRPSRPERSIADAKKRGSLASGGDLRVGSLDGPRNDG